jgi:hypothetical protein
MTEQEKGKWGDGLHILDDEQFVRTWPSIPKIYFLQILWY